MSSLDQLPPDYALPWAPPPDATASGSAFPASPPPAYPPAYPPTEYAYPPAAYPPPQYAYAQPAYPGQIPRPRPPPVVDMAGITSLTAPTARGAVLFADGYPVIDQFALEFKPTLCVCRSNPYPDRAVRIAELIDFDATIPAQGKDAGRRLLRYHTLFGLSAHPYHFGMILTMAILAVPLLVIGFYYYWWPFFVGVFFVIYSSYGLYKRCTQRKNAAVEMARIRGMLSPEEVEEVEI
jgi:hypothetical protein